MNSATSGTYLVSFISSPDTCSNGFQNLLKEISHHFKGIYENLFLQIPFPVLLDPSIIKHEYSLRIHYRKEI